MKLYLGLICLLTFSVQNMVYGQTIDQSAIYRQINHDRFIRLHYENDYFTATDRYYTQGINLELTGPFLKVNPLNHLLIRPKNYQVVYTLGIEHNGYTPSSISHAEILVNDHPFAACLMLKSVLAASQPESGIRIVSSLSTGVIGHSANGDWMQKSIHKWTNNIQPLGWENQVKNDLILNYQVNVDKKLIGFRNNLLLNASGEIRVGTLNDRAGAGLVLMAGTWRNMYGNPGKSDLHALKEIRRNFNFYLYVNPFVHLIGYNATLQGGIFNNKSPYVLKNNEISRVVLTNNAGIVLAFGKIYMEYFQSIQTKEFKTGLFHRWGGIKLGVAF